MSNKNYIKTSDPDTRQYLLDVGLEIIEESNGITTFLNDTSKKATFEKKKVVFTNIRNM